LYNISKWRLTIKNFAGLSRWAAESEYQPKSLGVRPMTKVDEKIAALRLFNEKVRELLESSFVKAVSSPNAGFSISWERHKDGNFKMSSTVRGPSVEAVKAFVLTFRFFIQDNESISLRNIAALYDSSNIDTQQRAYFQSARDQVNQLLDSPNFFNLNYNGVTPTNRQVMDVFVYGGLAHANPEKYNLYKEWMSFSPSGVILQACFNAILGHILHALAYIEQVNETTLQQLTNGKS
jgi:hypothetical protein